MLKIKKQFSWSWWDLFWLILVSALVFNPFGSFQFEITKITYLLVFLVIFGVTLISNFWQQKWHFCYDKKLLWGIFYLLLLLTVSTVFSVSPLESFWGGAERMQGVYAILLYVLVMLTAYQLLAAKKIKPNGFWFALTAVSSVLAVLAILQYWGWNFTGTDMARLTYRPPATFGHPNDLGQWLLISILAGHFALIGNKSKSRWWILGALFLQYIALGLTQNKASFLGLAAGLTILYWLRFHFLSMAGKIVLITLVVIMVSLGGLIYLQSSRSTSSRMLIWPKAWALSWQKPLTGHGLETYYYTAQSNLDTSVFDHENLFDKPDYIHNITLQVFHDWGLFGLIGFLALAGLIIRSLVHNQDVENQFAVLALLASGVALQFGFSLTAQNIVLAIILAIWFWKNTAGNQSLVLKSQLLKIAIFFTLIVIGGVALFNQAKLEKINYLMAESIKNLFQQPTLAKLQQKEILDLNLPFRYFNYFTLQFASIDQPQAKEMDKYLQNLSMVTNRNFPYWLAKADLKSKRGEFKEARNAYQEAKRLAPHDPQIFLSMAELAWQKGDWQEVVNNYEELINLMPDYWQKDFVTDAATANQQRIYYKNHGDVPEWVMKLALAYRQLGDEEGGKKWMEKLPEKMRK